MVTAALSDLQTHIHEYWKIKFVLMCERVSETHVISYTIHTIHYIMVGNSWIKPGPCEWKRGTTN